MLSFVLGSENRKKIVQTLLAYPKRQWSCSTLEDVTKISHATVFRTLQGLTKFGLLKSFKINKKDILYEIASDSPWVDELARVLNIEQNLARDIAKTFIKHIKKHPIRAVILYGSAVKGPMKPESDIDLLVVVEKHDAQLEQTIHDKTGEVSSRMNKTLSITILDVHETRQKTPFTTSVQAHMEVLYGKSPF